MMTKSGGCLFWVASISRCRSARRSSLARAVDCPITVARFVAGNWRRRIGSVASRVVPPKVPPEEVVELPVVWGELGSEAGARLGPHVMVGARVVHFVTRRTPRRQPEKGQCLLEPLIRPCEK